MMVEYGPASALRHVELRQDADREDDHDRGGGERRDRDHQFLTA